MKKEEIKPSLLKIISCVLVAIVVSCGISLCFPPQAPRLSHYLPIIIGTFLGGYIAGNKGWIVGVSAGILNFLIIQVIFLAMALSSIGRFSLPPFEPSLLILFIIIGAAFGGLGQLAKKCYIALKKRSIERKG